ncbi:MAG TPA: GAF domain-containing protein [Anaerolineae bacterium]|nr:GAF domain-containing protein [Anaerolineae bacterium]
MPSLSIHRIWQFTLLAGAICVLVLTPAAWLLVRVTGAESAGVWALLAATVVLASSIVAGLVTLTFGAVLQALIGRLHRLSFRQDEAGSGVGQVRKPFAAVEDLATRIAADQESLRRRNSELEVLASISHALNRASQLDEVLDTALNKLSRLRPYKCAYIALVDEQTSEPRLVASRGYSDAELEAMVERLGPDGRVAGLACYPLRTNAGVIGTLGLQIDSLDSDTQRSLSLLADVLATAVEKCRWIESAQREVRAQKLLNRAGRVLTSTLESQEVLTRVMREVIQALNAEDGSVVLVDEARSHLYFAAVASPVADDLIGTAIPMGHGIVGWAIERGESVLAQDARTDERHYEQIDQQTGMSTQSIICVPLVSRDKVIGAIEVMNSKSGQFTLYDLQLLESLAPQAAIAIENAFLFENVKQQMAELERTQGQLFQAEKLSAIGELVAGVAHELNNPLTAVVGYAQLLLETCEDPEVCEDLGRINREAQRSARIVQNLLAFARQQSSEKHSIELGQALDKAIDLLAYQLQVNNISLVREISPEPMIALGDRYQLQQVFLNLITNAYQAMYKAYGRGTLTIRTERVNGNIARICFADDGPGVPAEIANRVFDPFFTTKDVGEGTGLGLSICLGIVQEHEGRIWLDQEVERGATFVIELPLDGEEQGVHEEDLKLEPIRYQGLSILVIDDEPEIVFLLQRVLEGEGYDVVAVNGGHEALEALSRRSYDLVICDLKMPGIGGRDIFDYVTQNQPELADRMIFTTGDTVSSDSRAFLQETQQPFISKPFKPHTVLAQVGALLSR